MTLDDELRRFETNVSADAEIARVLPCEPFDKDEVHLVVGVIATWKNEGRLFGMWRDDWPENLEGSEAYLRLLLEEADRGIFSFRAYDLGTDFRLCKVSAGRGWFGGQRIRFHWYLSIGQNEFVPASTSGNLISAFAQVGSIYREHGL